MKNSTKPQPVESRAAKTLREIFQSGRPLTYIRSAEEQRIGRLLREVGRTLYASAPVPVWTWSLTQGLLRDDAVAQSGTLDPREALDFIAAHKDAAIFHLKDFHEPLRESPEVRRRLRDLYESCLDQRKFVVISSPVRFVPEEIERDIVYLELRPPDLIELVELLRSEARRLSAPDASEETLYQLARALQGVTLQEARHAVRRALAVSPTLGPESLPALLEEKRLLVNRGGVIEFVADSTSIGEVGGLEKLKQWLLERRKLFQLRESLSTDIVPKGVLVMGIPGCGKSLCIKAISSHFELPLYRIDMIEVFSGRHGEPEGAFVQACKTLEDMAPAVVWFDEIEMGISSGDPGGEQGRIFAFFLTWMQEKARGLFVAATANRIDLLPAEMIRKGRFDEVFFVDLPLVAERIEILKIHLGRREIDASKFDLERLADFMKGWTGAEIEQTVVSALTRARLKDHEVTEQDLFLAAGELVPLARTMKEQINHIRAWAFERAVRASPIPSGG
ncbi:MAG: AAA family ATPase [Candidatus Binatus sp.]|jgi:SpoVK/Ycf46/Vps4 family AAA+-type ATPase|uniref:AAA family ATPase n=1 Tax=Candidatus Binatus sp. TaxID=2811406 RepID=UPI003D0E39BE